MSTSDPSVSAGEPRDEAIPKLMAAHGGQLYALGVRMCGDRTEAEDLVQETFLQAYRFWDQFEGRSQPSTWLFTIASRVCQRLHRRRAGEPARIDSLDELLPFGEAPLAAVPTAISGPERLEIRDRVEAALAELPLEFRMPVVLKEIVGFSIAEVARILDLKPGTVKTRVHRGRLRLRQVVDAALPRQTVDPGPPPYSKQMCLDLLAAKQQALDHGVEFDEEIICDRCRTVFAELDLASEACRQIASGEMPPTLARQLQEQLEQEAAASE